ncbi:MAG: hypothetical protein R2715_05055 [Ilumatobacteraceae bacterium]
MIVTLAATAVASVGTSTPASGMRTTSPAAAGVPSTLVSSDRTGTISCRRAPVGVNQPVTSTINWVGCSL